MSQIAVEKSVIVLGKYTDALHLSVMGKLKDGVLEDLAFRKKSSLQAFLAGYIDVPGIPGGPLLLSPHKRRGKYEFILRNEAIYLEVTRTSNFPALLIQFQSHVLYQHDLQSLQQIVNTLAAFFLEPRFSTLVRRFDLALDFQSDSWKLDHVDKKDIITRARKTQMYLQRSQTQTIGAPNGNLQVQIYDKTQEIEVSGKTWMLDVWRDSEQFNESLAVLRVEYRFQRPKLQEHGIDTIDDLQRSMGDLVRSVVGDEGVNPWIRFASPDTRDRRQDRRPAASWWKEIKEASMEGVPISGHSIDRSKKEPDLQHDLATFFAYLERIIAQRVMAEDLHPDDALLDDTVEWLKDLYHLHLASKELDFSQAIKARMLKMNLTSTLYSVSAI